MAEVMITEGMKQQVITRLATINSAISIFNLTNGKPAKVSVEEVLGLAERIERWARRDLLSEQPPDARAPEKPAPQAEPAKAEPEPAAVQGDRPQPKPSSLKPNGGAQWGGAASEKQIAAIFGIGGSKGYEPDELKARINEKLGKSVMQLTSREASKLIDDLRAL